MTAKVGSGSSSSCPISTYQSERSSVQQISCHRERPSFLYSGIRSSDTIDHLFQEKPKTPISAISEKCACAMVVGIISAIFISLSSIVIVFLLLLGFLTPLSEFRPLLLDSETAKIPTNLNVENQVEKLNNMLKFYNNTVELLQNRTKSFDRIKSQQINNEVRNEVKRFLLEIEPETLANLLRGITGGLLSECRHESFSVGMSSIQTEANSGEFYADQDHVITGVTCSSTGGFIGALESSVTRQGNEPKIRYKCRCSKVSSSLLPSSGRAECRIDYWQCLTAFD